MKFSAGSARRASVVSEVVRRLLEAGVNDFADLAKGEETFYMPDGRTHVERINLRSDILPLTSRRQELSLRFRRPS